MLSVKGTMNWSKPLWDIITCWRRWKSPFDRKKFRAQCNSVRSLISKAKSSCLSNLVTESFTNPRTLWKTLNTILHRNPSNSFPESPDASSLANTFLDFFKDKIKLIAFALNFYHLIPLIRFFFHLPRPQRWSILFQPLSLKPTNSFLLLKVNNVPWIPSQLSFWNSASMNSVQSSQILSISLFLKEFFYRHSNKLLSSLFPKKTSLSTDDLNNFRPISNLIFISKILEKIVASRIQSHLSSNSLSSSFPSAHRIFHSTETTLLKIHNDLIFAMDRGEVISLILLDLSAAFDTVDHSILLTRLQNWFGHDGLSLDWFTSYLSLRSQAVSINDSISAFSTLSSLAQNNSVSNFLIEQTYLSAMISSQSVPLLAILASSLTLTCLSLIKSTLYPNLVIFISETSVEFVIFFLFLQPQLLQIHLSPANLTIAIHFTLVSHKQISTNFNAFKIHWHVSLQILQNINTSHQHSKNYTGFLSNKESITKRVFSHTKHLQINNLHIFTIVFHSRHILSLYDLLIHLFFPYHMSDRHLAKGLSLSSVHDSGIHSPLIPGTRILYQYSVPDSKHTSSKLRPLPRLFPISLDCLPRFWFLLFSFYALSNDT